MAIKEIEAAPIKNLIAKFFDMNPGGTQSNSIFDTIKTYPDVGSMTIASFKAALNRMKDSEHVAIVSRKNRRNGGYTYARTDKHFELIKKPGWRLGDEKPIYESDILSPLAQGLMRNAWF